MNQDEFNDAERESKLRMELIHESTKKPKREWVGLTREEILEARWHNKSSYKFARVLEDMLRERNT